MRKTRISATKAARTFSDILNRVCYRNETFLIERRGRPVCEMTPAKPSRFTIEELAALLHTIPHPDAEYLDVVDDLIANQQPVAKSRWRH